MVKYKINSHVYEYTDSNVAAVKDIYSFLMDL